MVLGDSTNWDTTGPATWPLVIVVLVTASLVTNLKYKRFSRWVAPWLGAFIVGSIGLLTAKEEPNPWIYGGFGGILGFMGGCFICVLDPRQVKSVSDGNPDDSIRTKNKSIQKYPGSLIGRSLAVLTIIGFCIPFISLMMGAIAMILNWQSGGWARIVSIAGTILSLIFTIWFIVHYGAPTSG